MYRPPEQGASRQLNSTSVRAADFLNDDKRVRMSRNARNYSQIPTYSHPSYSLTIPRLLDGRNGNGLGYIIRWLGELEDLDFDEWQGLCLDVANFRRQVPGKTRPLFIPLTSSIARSGPPILSKVCPAN